jgi:crotonobetainyl-CoA:carnitine CoA-transferase CaiB-like acyl-CoA transferase
MGSQAIIAGIGGEVPLRMGNDGQGSAPSGLFACKNGEVLIQAGKDPDFVKLCGVLGMQHLLDDPRFAQRARRVENYPILQPMLIEAIAKWDRQELYDKLVDAGVICGPVTNIVEALLDPQVVSNKIEVCAGHPDDPDLKLIASPIRFGDDVEPVRRYPPRMGEHGVEVLKELLHMDDAAIARLAAVGAIEAP